MRIEKVMDVTIAREIERLERRLLVLATVGSAGPFIGLFGTVWGIMTSFQSIAASKNTSLAVVAPGIAEALFATAIGLVAAIPATIFYNKFVVRGEQAGAAAGGLRRRIRRDPVAADRRARRMSAHGCVASAVAASGGPSIGGKRRHRRRTVMSEINVTPMVDVMLVLLIIFMVSAPLLTVGVPIDLPQTQAKSLDQDKEPLTVSVNDKGEVFLQNAEINDRRSGPQAAGDRAGARRHRSAHLCARRQEGRLRHDDAGDGPAVGGRLPPGRAGDRIRAGLESNADEDGIGDFGRAARRGAGCGRLLSFCRQDASRRRRPESLPVDLVSDEGILRDDQGRQGRAQAGREAEAAGREESRGAPKPVEELKPQGRPRRKKMRRRQEKPTPPQPRAEARSDRREAQEAEDRPKPQEKAEPKPLPPKKPPPKPQPKFDADKIAALLDKRDAAAQGRHRRRT